MLSPCQKKSHSHDMQKQGCAKNFPKQVQVLPLSAGNLGRSHKSTVTVCVNAQVTSDYAIVATICAAAHSTNITCVRPLNVLKFLGLRLSCFQGPDGRTFSSLRPSALRGVQHVTSLLYLVSQTAFCFSVVSGCFVDGASPSPPLRSEPAPERGLEGLELAFRTPESARKIHAKSFGPWRGLAG